MRALDYHELTKHSVQSVHSSRHFLDWDNQPLPFKVYTQLEALPLPRDFATPPAPGSLPDTGELARLLHFTAGILRARAYPDGRRHYFRAAACTGALYHVDVYVACADLAGLEAGLYHFGPHDFALRRLRAGDHRRVLIDASGGDPALASAPIALVFTSTFWRNAWKYQARTYRHCFWDAGTMLANALAICADTGRAARVVTAFADDAVNELLALDASIEVALCCLAIGRDGPPAPPAPPFAAIADETLPLSAHPVEYPAIGAAHAGSRLADGAAARAWRERAYSVASPPPQSTLYPLAPQTPDEELRGVEEGIAKRGSARRFALQPIRFTELSRILRAATAALDADFRPAPSGVRSARLSDLYLIVNAVDDLASGTYVFRPEDDALEALRTGDFRGEAGHLDLGQELAANAAVNFYSLCDLDQVVSRLGDRGYRAASLEAAITGGRIYLSAYRQRLGATGLTFFDDEVTDFFSPHAAGKGVLFLTAVGHPLRVR